MSVQLVCPKCLRTVEVLTVNVTASCEHGKPSGRFNVPTVMVALDRLAAKAGPVRASRNHDPD